MGTHKLYDDCKQLVRWADGNHNLNDHEFTQASLCTGYMIGFSLVFQSVKDGRPMNDQNILKRHIQPAARTLGLPFVNWRCLGTSHATWLVQAGADPKSIQGQMRHSRISTTMEIYAQIVPAAQRRALQQLSEFAAADSRSITGPIKLVFHDRTRQEKSASD